MNKRGLQNRYIFLGTPCICSVLYNDKKACYGIHRYLLHEISAQYLCIQLMNSNNTYFYSSGIIEVITDRDVLTEELSEMKDEAERTALEKKTSAKTAAATEATQEEFLRDQVIILIFFKHNGCSVAC